MRDAARFFATVTTGRDADDCWVWGGKPNPGGYGRFRVGGRAGRTWLAHRWSYEHLIGAVPAGLVLDHLCRNRLCVNPWHLDPVTIAENLRRGRTYQLEKTHCPHGHPYDGANTYVTPDGHRECRTCRTDKARRHAPKKRAYLRSYRARNRRPENVGAPAPTR